MKTRTKILITILLAVLYFLVSQSIRAAEMCLLQDDYTNFNRDYFLGQLPDDVNVEWADLGLQHDMGTTWIDEAGTRQIRIDRRTNPVLRQARLTLLHEDCHIRDHELKLDEGIDGHGINFQKCMVNLADQGAFHDLW